MYALHLVLQFSEAVRVWTSSSERALPGLPVSTGRSQDPAMREKMASYLPPSFHNLPPDSLSTPLLNKLQQWDLFLN